jgi:hypothetical protein
MRNEGQAGDAAAASGNVCRFVTISREQKNKARSDHKWFEFTSGRHGDLLIRQNRPAEGTGIDRFKHLLQDAGQGNSKDACFQQRLWCLVASHTVLLQFVGIGPTLPSLSSQILSLKIGGSRWFDQEGTSHGQNAKLIWQPTMFELVRRTEVRGRTQRNAHALKQLPYRVVRRKKPRTFRNGPGDHFDPPRTSQPKRDRSARAFRRAEFWNTVCRCTFPLLSLFPVCDRILLVLSKSIINQHRNTARNRQRATTHPTCLSVCASGIFQSTTYVWAQ